MKGVSKGTENSHNLMRKFVNLYKSILKHASSDRHLHFVIMTDPNSVPCVERVFHRFAQKDMRDRYPRPRVTYEYFQISVLTQKYIWTIFEIRNLFVHRTTDSASKKYQDDLFFMGLFYHRVFPYKKFIVLDADLKFRIDIEELYDHFDHFTSEQIMGVGIDLYPHYRNAFGDYRKSHPGTNVGEPGRSQVIECQTSSPRMHRK
jgi:lipopolysaccharide biosynthesis glycosyltransferase